MFLPKVDKRQRYLKVQDLPKINPKDLVPPKALYTEEKYKCAHKDCQATASMTAFEFDVHKNKVHGGMYDVKRKVKG